MTYGVRFTRGATADLERLFDFVLQRELDSETGNPALAEQAIDAIRSGISTLRASPFTCRKAAHNPFLRELVIAFGRSGFVALFEIESAADVVVLAVRHQLEDDYH